MNWPGWYATVLLCLLAAPNLARAASPFIERLDAGTPQKVVVYGTSLTAGGAWVGQLSSGLNAQYPGQITWVNSGMSGRASNSGVANLSERVLAHNPDVVFLEFAINDSFTAYATTDIDYNITPRKSIDNLEAMIDAIRAARPDCEIILQTMNPAWNAPNGNQSGSIRPNIATYYQGYRDVAADRGLTIVDNYTVWNVLRANEQSRFESYIADGTHPNSSGYQQLVTSAIRSLLGAENGMSLLVDPATGHMVMQNQSPEAVELIGYTIASNGGALRTDWHGLAFRGNVDWFAANATAQHLSELNPIATLSLAAQQVLDFGIAWNTNGALDLTFQYQVADGGNHTGTVIYTTTVADLVAVPGDYNHNGLVDAADYTVWRDNLGSGILLPNDDTSGVGFDDYDRWKSSFGQTARVDAVAIVFADSVSAVPEPAAFVLALLTASGWCLRLDRMY